MRTDLSGHAYHTYSVKTAVEMTAKALRSGHALCSGGYAAARKGTGYAVTGSAGTERYASAHAAAERFVEAAGATLSPASSGNYRTAA